MATRERHKSSVVGGPRSGHEYIFARANYIGAVCGTETHLESAHREATLVV
jgi:phosphoenolpyruvate-protein kinase (PTS system EI component)